MILPRRNDSHLGFFGRDTDTSDDEPSFEPVEGTVPDGGGGQGGNGADDEHTPFDGLEAVRLRDDDFSGTLKRAVDWEAGVVLYAYNSGHSGGLAAVPIQQTRFGRE